MTYNEFRALFMLFLKRNVFPRALVKYPMRCGTWDRICTLDIVSLNFKLTSHFRVDVDVFEM